jgi:hypothetical protein
MTNDELVALFNRHNHDLDRMNELGLERLGPAAARRSDQVDRWLYDPVVNRPHDAWPILDALVENVDDRPDGALDYLAAGPVEDFVKLHGVEFLDLLEAAARNSPRWRRALEYVRPWDGPNGIDRRVADRLRRYIRLDIATSSSE